MIFRGRFEYAIGPKGRVNIPSPFRERLQESGQESFVLTNFSGCLYAFPADDWARIEEKLSQVPTTDRRKNAFVRFFVGGAVDVTPDKQGRVLVPPSLRTYAVMKTFAALLRRLVVLSIPMILIGAGLRLILLPAYLQIEYRMPSFPADTYGCSTADRLPWATLTWRYLVDTSGTSSLAELRFGDGSPLFNEREVSHMADVKAVVQFAFAAWIAALAVIASASIFFWRTGSVHELRQGVRHGGWFTIGLAGFIGIVVGLGMVADPEIFWEFFTIFHGLFFKGDSWLFAYSDTLIRLFPIRFWQDTFLAAALIILPGGFALAFGVRQPASPSPDRR